MILVIAQIIVSTLLIGVILMQVQGTGLSGSFGGGGEFYRSRRSAERVLFITTLILSAIFALCSILLLFPQ